jgi:hypothetical protein
MKRFSICKTYTGLYYFCDNDIRQILKVGKNTLVQTPDISYLIRHLLNVTHPFITPYKYTDEYPNVIFRFNTKEDIQKYVDDNPEWFL